MPRIDVDEFKIQIVSDHKVRVEWRGQSDSGDLELDKLRLRTFEVLIGLLRRNQLLQVDELKILGEHLFVTLFGPGAASSGPPDDGSGGPGALLRKAIRGDREHPDAGRRLLKVMLEIKVGSDRFGSWPWEYLYVPENPIDPNTGFFLGERTNFVLTRQLALVDSAPAIQVRPPLRILFVVLSPSDLPPIEYEAVLETLLHLRDAGGESRIDLWVLTEEHGPDGTRYADPGTESRTTYRAFMDCVDQFDPHVIHIISHGRYRTNENAPCGQLAFTREDSTAGWIGDQDLASMLMDISSLRLVFLQACETADTSSNPYQVISGVAQWLAQKNIPAVIAMHFLVQSSLANEFARAFYKSLVERAAIEVAMHAARRQLYTSGVVGDSQRTGFGLPVLYLRGSGALLTPLESPTDSVEDPAGERRAAADSLPSDPGLSRAWDGDIGIARHTA